MTKEEIVAYSATLKPMGLNCAQSVIKALEEFIGPDAEVMIKAASGLGGGMGCMEATCGALIGASMVASQRLGGIGQEPLVRSITKSKEILKEFEKQCGATLCRDLKGAGTGKMLCSCPDCIRNATRIAIDELGLFPEE